MRKLINLLKSSDPKSRFKVYLLISPSLLWLFFFFLLPLGIIFVYSFCQSNPEVPSGITWNFTFDNYLRIINPKWSSEPGSADPKPFILRSLWLAIINTALCLIIGYPMAYYISKRPAKIKSVLLVLVILPFWTNYLVRTYAWMIILRDNGLINTILMNLGLIQEPVELLFTRGAVMVGLVYGYLPFMVLPLYASIEKVNQSYIEAAHDLGANSFQTFLRITLPLTIPGIIAGSALVFIPTIGAYVTPDLLGGAKVMMIGNAIKSQYLAVKNLPFGSALSFILLSLVLIILFLYAKLGDSEENDG